MQIYFTRLFPYGRLLINFEMPVTCTHIQRGLTGMPIAVVYDNRNAEQTTIIKKRTHPCVRLFRLDHIFVVIVYINNRLVQSTEHHVRVFVNSKHRCVRIDHATPCIRIFDNCRYFVNRNVNTRSGISSSRDSRNCCNSCCNRFVHFVRSKSLIMSFCLHVRVRYYIVYIVANALRVSSYTVLPYTVCFAVMLCASHNCCNRTACTLTLSALNGLSTFTVMYLPRHVK